MKCPYCGYIYGWDFDNDRDIRGRQGEFYKISNNVKMEKDSQGYGKDVTTKNLRGCPSCDKVFMD